MFRRYAAKQQERVASLPDQCKVEVGGRGGCLRAGRKQEGAADASGLCGFYNSQCWNQFL